MILSMAYPVDSVGRRIQVFYLSIIVKTNLKYQKQKYSLCRKMSPVAEK